jgi:LSD1 subclass zinc finger protein
LLCEVRRREDLHVAVRLEEPLASKSPWQRDTSENTNTLLRQYSPSRLTFRKEERASEAETVGADHFTSPRASLARATTLCRGASSTECSLCQATLSIGLYLLLEGAVPTVLIVPKGASLKTRCVRVCITCRTIATAAEEAILLSALRARVCPLRAYSLASRHGTPPPLRSAPRYRQSRTLEDRRRT